MLGVDACKKGWAGDSNHPRGDFGPTILQPVTTAADDGDLEVVAIDIPIALPTSGPRQADPQVRKLVGRRTSPVFPTPVRAALTAGTHTEATAISVDATRKGLSQQAFALKAKRHFGDGPAAAIWA